MTSSLKTPYKLAKALLARQEWRFIINGGFATTVHYTTLVLLNSMALISSIGLANGIASCFGITSSFLGNRYFVFDKIGDNIFTQFKKFVFVYITIAAGHTLLMYLWADISGLNYHVGFVLLTAAQIVLSYSASKYVIFI